ncbi:MAG TPA: LD-carboxypeptidase [Phnomibacter sp.]|nr:LD-carboxypeptidase [Phnomibacter sp.]
MPVTIPPYLRKGQTIGLVCTAGFMPAERVQHCTEQLAAWGLQVQVGDTIGHQHHYFAGTDAERLADLQQMLDNPEVHAILCARGGYGTSRIIDQVNWRRFKKHPKWIIGFSDVTVLHSYLYTRLHIASMHAPMAAAFLPDNRDEASLQSLKAALFGKATAYKLNTHPFNRPGQATGPLLGGNLSLLTHQVGTPSDINTRGAILFIEDVGEYLYNIDRMLLQLDRAGKLANLAGLVVGGFTEGKDTTVGFGATVEEIIAQRVSKYSFPVCFGFPVSHGQQNVCLKTGCTYQIKVGRQVTLKEV